VHIVALMSPGPDFFFVSQTAVSRSRKEAMMGVLGITTGVMVWAGVALLGLNLILEKMAWLHTSLWSAAACTCAGWATRCCAVR
jgi:threonine efflux protein